MTKWVGSGLSIVEKRENKRKLIIRHAASIFNRRGNQGTTLDDVAAKLMISKAALYRYVDNKNDLLVACHTEAVRIALNAADRSERLGGDGWTKIQLTLQRHLEDMIEILGVPAMLFEENSLDDESIGKILELRDEYESRLRQFYKEGVVDGSVLPGNAKIAIFSLLGALNWTAKWYDIEGDWKSDEVAEAVVETAMRGIAAKPKNVFLSLIHASETDG